VRLRHKVRVKSVRSSILFEMTEQIERELEAIDRAILATLPLYEPIATSPLFSPEQCGLLMNLSTACFNATAATLLLVENGRTWEAEITLRSAAEGSLKFAHLLSSHAEFNNRFREYTEALPDIAILKSHDRAQELLNLSVDPAAPELEPIRRLLVPKQQLEELRQKYPRDVRGKLEQAWSFTGLADSLSRSPHKTSKVFRALLYGYWSANQLTHMTWEGISMPMERRMREESRRLAVDNAHASRVLSDCFSYCVLRLSSGLEYVGADLAALRALLSARNAESDALNSLWKEWHNLEFPEAQW
jgi:hypothetical protein